MAAKTIEDFNKEFIFDMLFRKPENETRKTKKTSLRTIMMPIEDRAHILRKALFPLKKAKNQPEIPDFSLEKETTTVHQIHQRKARIANGNGKKVGI